MVRTFKISSLFSVKRLSSLFLNNVISVAVSSLTKQEPKAIHYVKFNFIMLPKIFKSFGPRNIHLPANEYSSIKGLNWWSKHCLLIVQLKRPSLLKQLFQPNLTRWPILTRFKLGLVWFDTGQTGPKRVSMGWTNNRTSLRLDESELHFTFYFITPLP